MSFISSASRRRMPAFVVSSVAAGLLLAMASTTHAATFNGSGALTTDYVWRGTTQTQGDPAVQAGFDYQFAPNWVLGAEAQYSWLGGGNNNNGVIFPLGTVVTGRVADQIGSVTGRVGYTWGPALLYAKGGYAWRDGNNVGVSVAGVPAGFTTNGNHKDGYTVGGGLEYMFAPNWSAKAEYQYYNFGNATFTSGPADITGRSFKNDEHTAKVGVNYRFGWGGPAASRY